MTVFRRTSPWMGLLVSLLVVALSSLLCGASGVPPARSQPHSQFRSQRSQPSAAPSYLVALGDSITFGYSPLIPPSDTADFIGFPSYVAQDYGWPVSDVYNYACPGATSSYALSLADDWQCGVWRAQYPLHVNYTGAQVAAAAALISGLVARHQRFPTQPSVGLVTVMLGFDDLEALGAGCDWDAGCVAEGLPQTQVQLTSRLRAIVGELRGAGYAGPIALVTYYAINTDPQMTSDIQAINSAIADAASATGALLADGFAAFADASAGYGGDPCAAGLLVQTAPGVCDMHPSVAGQRVLAQAVEQAW